MKNLHSLFVAVIIILSCCFAYAQTKIENNNIRVTEKSVEEHSKMEADVSVFVGWSRGSVVAIARKSKFYLDDIQIPNGNRLILEGVHLMITEGTHYFKVTPCEWEETQQFNRVEKLGYPTTTYTWQERIYNYKMDGELLLRFEPDNKHKYFVVLTEDHSRLDSKSYTSPYVDKYMADFMADSGHSASSDYVRVTVFYFPIDSKSYKRNHVSQIYKLDKNRDLLKDHIIAEQIVSLTRTKIK